MALELIPNGELTFKGPFNVVSVTTLQLVNNGKDRLAYKIKTTAPKRYCVKPNSGFLNANANASVQVMLQPQSAGSADDRTKHKFMVQWVAVPNTYLDSDVDNFWKQDPKILGVQDSKLKCVFMDEQPTVAVSNDPQGAADTNAPTSRAAEPTYVSENRSQQRSAASSPLSTFTSRSPVTVTRSTHSSPTTNQEHPKETTQDSTDPRFKENIDRLREENTALKERLKQQESGLRQRPVSGSPASDRVKSIQQQANGLVLFGIALTEQVLLVAFVIALLLGFSFGYFLFSCNN